MYFTGHVTNAALTAYYRSASVYLCLSEHEGFCVPLVEAMHFGLPIVARAAAGVPGTLGSGGILLAALTPCSPARCWLACSATTRCAGRSGSAPGRGWRPSGPRWCRRRCEGCCARGSAWNWAGERLLAD